VVCPRIDADSGQSGVIGDIVPSVITDGTQERHFVSPKATSSDYVMLTATAPGVTSSNFGILLEWDSSVGTDVPGSPNKWRVSRGTTGNFTVKLKRVNDHTEVARINVWIVWATGSITHTPTLVNSRQSDTTIDGTSTTSTVTSSGTTDYWTFQFTISPSSITDNTGDIPDLTGGNTIDAPGAGTHSPSPGEGDLAGGAEAKWDVSRRYSFTISNPDSIPRGKFTSDFGSIYSASIPNGAAVSLPSSSLIGNDDANTGDEDNNLYQSSSGAHVSHSIGQIASYDKPALFMPDAGGATDDTIEQDDLFQEFARLQIGSQWYLISDPLQWKIIQKVKFGSGEWQDNGSTLGAGN